MKTLISKFKAWLKRFIGCSCPCYTQDKIQINKTFRKKPGVKGKRVITRKVKAKK